MDVMDNVVFGPTITGMLSALMLAVTLATIAFSRIKTSIRLFALHSLVLSLFAASVAFFAGNPHLYVTAILTLLIKVIVLPKYLLRTHIKTSVRSREAVSLNLPVAYLIANGLIILAYTIMDPLIASGSASLFLARSSLTAGTSIVFIGFLLMLIRRELLSQIIGLLILENGIFLAALAATDGMPLIVEIGVFFDLVMVVIILGVLSDRIRTTFDPAGGSEGGS